MDEKLKNVLESVVEEFKKEFTIPDEVYRSNTYDLPNYLEMAKMMFAHDIMKYIRIRSDGDKFKDGSLKYEFVFRCIPEENLPSLYRRIKRIYEKEEE